MLYYKNDTTGVIATFLADPGTGWTVATQQQLDDLALKDAKNAKVTELKNGLIAWRDAGFVYTGSLPAAATFNLSKNSARYADVKSSRRLGGLNKSKFYDQATPRKQHDFGNDAGFDGFVNAINEEEERIMEKDNAYEEQIEEAATLAAVNAIIINFAP